MAGDPTGKAARALRTIGEVSAETGVAQHILRFWEGRFPGLKPLQRAGGRRYYRPDDVALVRRIDTLLNHDGYTIRGVQQLLAAEAAQRPTPERSSAAPAADPIRTIRDALAAALTADAER